MGEKKGAAKHTSPVTNIIRRVALFLIRTGWDWLPRDQLDIDLKFQTPYVRVSCRPYLGVYMSPSYKFTVEKKGE